MKANELRFIERVDDVAQWLISNHRIKNVIITGGEPLVVSALPEIIGRLKKGGKSLTLYTNGTLLNVILLNNLIERGVSKIRISVDSISGTCGGRVSVYGQIEGWAERCQASGVVLEVGVTLTSEAGQIIEDIYRIRTQCLELGVLFSISPEFPQNKAKVMDPVAPAQLELLMELKYFNSISACLDSKIGFSCPATRNLIAILPDGRISPCDNLSGCFISCESVLDVPLAEILKSDRNVSRFCEVINDGIDACSVCKYKVICNGGCRAMAYLCDDLEGCDHYARQRLDAYYQKCGL